jgi:hypothetical protein
LLAIVGVSRKAAKSFAFCSLRLAFRNAWRNTVHSCVAVSEV